MKEEKTQILSLQAALVIFAGTVGTAYFPLSSVLVDAVETSGWLVVLVTFLLTTPWVLIATWLAKQAPAGNFGAAVEVWLGPIISKVFLFWFAAYWLLLGSGVLAEVSFVFHVTALPETPIKAVQVASLLLVIYTDWHGFETCMRTIQALLLLAAPLMLVFLISAVVASDWSRLLPIVDGQWLDFAKATIPVAPYPLGGILLSLILTTKVANRRLVAGHNILANWAAGILLSLTVAITIAVLGCCVTRTYVYPLIPLAQAVNIGETLVGVDILVYPLWLLSGYIKSALSFTIASSATKALLPFLKQLWRTLGLGIIAMIIIMIPPNLSSTVEMISYINYLAYPFYLTIPGIALWVKLSKRGDKRA